MPAPADTILQNAAISTMDTEHPEATALAVRGGVVVRVGDAADMEDLRGPRTKTIDAGGRRVVPGLHDTHLHLIRAGLQYALEVRWEDLTSLADGLERLRQQADVTPEGHWVRVVGGWSEHQFAERRVPTLDEINAVSANTPVFVLHLYHCVLLNRAGLRAAGITRDTPEPPGARIERDARGEPTGLIVATPNAGILYATLAKAPRLDAEHQETSTLHFVREMNRLGVTSCGDPGGGAQNYPDDYRAVERLHRDGRLDVRIAYSLFPQKPGQELADFKRWTGMIRPGHGDAHYRHVGAGEMLVYAGADFENWAEERPDLPPNMERELRAVLLHLVQERWPFRLHATYDESIRRFLDVIEGVNAEVPLDGLRWFLDHCETISPESIARVKALGGGVAVQHRLAYQGEHFAKRHPAQLSRAPPFADLARAGVPVSLGTDATRVAGYNPWVALHWAVTGRTLGNASTREEAHLVDREKALAMMTRDAAWFAGPGTNTGVLAEGRPADLAVLNADYFSVPEEEIRHLRSVLTMLAGRVVHAEAPYGEHAPPPPPPLPEWMPFPRRGERAPRPASGSPAVPRGTLATFVLLPLATLAGLDGPC